MSETKSCSRCLIVKPCSEFYRRSDHRHLLKSHCKTCVISKSGAYLELVKQDPIKRARLREREKTKMRTRRLSYDVRARERQYDHDRRQALDVRERELAYGRSYYRLNADRLRANARVKCRLEADGIDRVYFMLSVELNRIKIGYTNAKLTRRLRESQVGSADELRMLGELRAPRTEEKRLHHRFRDLHVRGEWFRAEKALLDFIDENCMSFEG